MPTAETDFNMREQVVRIDHMIEEARKFSAEQHKFAAETRRLDREYRWFPWLQLASSGVIAAVIAAIVAHWR